MDIEMHTVVSSDVSKVGYDKESNTLAIAFKNGSTYNYEGVPLAIYRGIFKAESVGKYLHQWIIGKSYKTVKQTPNKKA